MSQCAQIFSLEPKTASNIPRFLPSTQSLSVSLFCRALWLPTHAYWPKRIHIRNWRMIRLQLFLNLGSWLGNPPLPTFNLSLLAFRKIAWHCSRKEPMDFPYPPFIGLSFFNFLQGNELGNLCQITRRTTSPNNFHGFLVPLHSFQIIWSYFANSQCIASKIWHRRCSRVELVFFPIQISFVLPLICINMMSTKKNLFY